MHLQGTYTTPELVTNVLMIGNGRISYSGHYHVTVNNTQLTHAIPASGMPPAGSL